MLVLSVDTSGRDGSIALARGDADSFEQLEAVPLAGGTFSAQLVPQIAGLLAGHGFSKEDLDGFVVTSGPGSFTGLRVGLAVIKALAEVLDKPIAAVSRLEELAVASQRQGILVAALDAGRGDVYYGEYKIEGGASVMVEERLLARPEFLERAGKVVVVTSDSVVADAVRGAGFAVSMVDPSNGCLLARMGIRKILTGDVVTPAALEANYVRRSDAELFAQSHS